MAKQISQKTFDDVVRENMAEFDMDANEALQDAIQQFESQGVNLNIIVKDASLYAISEDGEVQHHPVVAAINKLSLALDNSSAASEDINDILKTIQNECDGDPARRNLAATNGAYPILFKALSCYKDVPENLNSVLKSFCALVDGQPDLIDASGIELLISLLKTYQNTPDTLELVIQAIRLNCIMHERNRLQFVNLNLIIILTEMLTMHRLNTTIIKEICICLRALTLDDDVRVPFGRATENAKTMVTEGDALKLIMQLCEEHRNDTSVLAELFLTLSCLAVRDEFCQEVMDRGGVCLIISACQSAVDDKAVVRQALLVLKALAGNDEVKHEIARLGGIELVVAAMNKYQNNAQVSSAACKVLTNITLRNTDNCYKVVECQGHEQIIQVMKIHPTVDKVQQNACMALRNLVSRAKELSECILALGAESLLNDIMKYHKDVADEAKAALRDLGCKVELRELWKGERGTIQ
uniref:LRRK2 ARM repeat domain-containing protein n=1 Tax=Arion vulgaris TaxID=1028688 RepID=A0A0B6Y9Z2_9EUPU